MKLITVVQARMSSSRLPGKVLEPIGDKTMLEWVLYRLSLCRSDLGPLVVATSVHEADDPIEALCDQIGVHYYRGRLADVLDRYHTLAHRLHADAVLRVTADCPLLSPWIVDTINDWFREGDHDYIGGDPLIADGLAQEIIGTDALDAAWKNAEGKDREHVITYTLNRPDQHAIGYVSWPAAESRRRFSIDTPADLKWLRELYAHRPSLFDLDIPELIAAADV